MNKVEQTIIIVLSIITIFMFICISFNLGVMTGAGINLIP
jgi:hypothetical protein